jgi:hypothetical protein
MFTDSHQKREHRIARLIRNKIVFDASNSDERREIKAF